MGGLPVALAEFLMDGSQGTVRLYGVVYPNHESLGSPRDAFGSLERDVQMQRVSAPSMEVPVDQHGFWHALLAFRSRFIYNISNGKQDPIPINVSLTSYHK